MPSNRINYSARALQVADALLGDKNTDVHCYWTALIGPFNDLAWKLVRCPPARDSDVALAVRLAENRGLGARPSCLLEHSRCRVLSSRGVARIGLSNPEVDRARQRGKCHGLVCPRGDAS